MKAILNFLLSKDVLIAILALIIGALVMDKCSSDKDYRADKRDALAIKDSILIQSDLIDQRRKQFEKENELLQLRLDRKSIQLEDNDSVYDTHYKWFNGEIKRLKTLNAKQASAIMDSLYANVPEAERDKAILIDLKEGERSDSLLAVATKRIGIMELFIDDQAEILVNERKINSDLMDQVNLHREEARVAWDLIAKLEKRLKKEKRLKWVGIGLGTAGVVFGLTR